MKITDALAIAASQFIQQFTNKSKTVQTLQLYATEQLQLPSDQANKFAIEAVDGQATEWLNTDEDKQRFFTWYCINHVDIVQRSKDTAR